MIIFSRHNALLLLILLFHLGAVVIDLNFTVLEGASPWEREDPKLLLSFCLFVSGVCIYIAPTEIIGNNMKIYFAAETEVEGGLLLKCA